VTLLACLIEMVSVLALPMLSAWPLRGVSESMSFPWITRLGLLVVLFALVCASRLLLGNRQKYREILENTPLAILDVVIYNACCYLAVGIPADPTLISAPTILKEPFVAGGFQAVGSILLVFGVCLFLATLAKRRVIGGQDTAQGLITSGVYRFSRHPIYLGIVLVSLSIPLIIANLDGIIVFPVVFLANACEAAIEENYDVGARFKEEYSAYRKTTWMFGPPWCWLALTGVLFLILTAGSLGNLRG
jgi:protein-S-isoprenylcysteine O-methyltransferase Ste14